MLFNGGGVEEAGGPGEPLTAALLANKAQLRWVNHTFDHPNLDASSQAQIGAQIAQNNAFAQTHALPGYNPAELVTGEHSGIGTSNPFVAANPNMAPALTAQGVTSIGADNSRESGQRQVGSALTLPRYPMNVFYNVSTWADQLDEYDWLYLDRNGGARRARQLHEHRRHDLLSEPRHAGPVHRARGIRRRPADALQRPAPALRPPDEHHRRLQRARRRATRRVQPRRRHPLRRHRRRAAALPRLHRHRRSSSRRQTALTQELRRQTAWANTTNQVTGFIQDGKVTLTTTSTRDVPITGTTIGDVYANQRSGWTTLTAGQTLTLELEEPRNTVAPAIFGQTATGGVLTATDGSFTGAPAITSRRWQRRLPGGPWIAIAGATTPTYTVAAGDVGQELRFVTTAANRVSTWGMGLSAPLAITATPVVIPPPATTPPPTTTTQTPAPATAARQPDPGTSPAAAIAPATGAQPADAAQPVLASAVTLAPFRCKVMRGRQISLACTIRDTSGRPRRAAIRAVRGARLLGRASGRVRRANQVPVLRLTRTRLRHPTRVTITIRLARGGLRSMSRTLNL